MSRKSPDKSRVGASLSPREGMERDRGRGGRSGGTRRRFLQLLAATGAGGTFGRALVALAGETGAVTPEMIRQAEWVSGLELTPEKRELMIGQMDELVAGLAELRAVEIDNAVPPALWFDPGYDQTPRHSGLERGVRPARPRSRAQADTANPDELAFATLGQLARLIKTREISSTELTRLYLDRIERYDPVLRCVISRTDELALRQAERADRELDSGEYRGPLHGIPWGAKDLLAVPGYRTTWGATPFRDQVRPDYATVARRLEVAGAVLVAKTSVGALAWGDVWYDATTKNPWNPEQGSSGSSAGSASAVAAGLAGFAIGTETWGSIVSPCTRCGATGLRPTYGRVSRHGAMALSWSMDKIGPIARSVEGCAKVFGAIHGADPRDPAARSAPFRWRDGRLTGGRKLADLRIGYVASQFDEDRTEGEDDEARHADLREWQSFDRATLARLSDLGLSLVPIELPDRYPIEPLGLILSAEAAAAFDELTRSGRDDQLVRQEELAWPNFFRVGQMVPAVEYIRANRIRTLVQRQMAELMRGVDLYVSPTFGGSNLLLTNLTGHPQVVLPNGFRSSDGTPTSITFTGRLWGESELLAVAHAYQRATGFHLRRPSGFVAPPEPAPIS